MINLIQRGRLGNQMFRYAAVRAYMINNNIKDLNMSFKNVYNNNFLNDLENFNIYKSLYNDKNNISLFQKIIYNLIKIIEKFIDQIYKSEKSYKKNRFELKIQPFLNKHGIFYLNQGYYNFESCKKKHMLFDGNFESSKYFNNCREDIIRELTPKQGKLKKNKRLYDIIEKNESVCITIRRGDFLNKKNKNAHYVCTEEYFYKSIDKIRELIKNPKFFVFSDDVEWCKNNMKFPKGTIFEDGSDPVWEKLRLMYCCKHFIISNSTFSWWAQYLSRNSDKIVIAPSRWKNTFQNEDIYEENWILIEP